MTLDSSSITTAASEWNLVYENRPFPVEFNPDTPSICVPVYRPENRIVWNVGTRLLVDDIGTTSGDRRIMVDVGSSLARADASQHSESQDMSTSMKKAVITSMDTIADSFDRNSLLLGFSTGQVQVMEPPSAHGDSRSVVSHYNLDRSLNSTSCILVSWVPTSHGSEFLSVHENGQVIRHHRITGNSSDKELLSRSERQSSSAEVCLLSHGQVTTAALSPDGTLLAVGTTDHGMLYVVDVASGHIVGGFGSFFGRFCCCTWSPDGRYIAAGGEDDLIAIWKIGSKDVLAHCQGHTSWPSSCTFEYSSETSIRLISVGHDCRLCVWEINIEPDGESPQEQCFVPTVKSREMNQLTPIFCEKLHIDPLSYVTSVSGKYMAVCAYDGTLKVYRNSLKP